MAKKAAKKTKKARATKSKRVLSKSKTRRRAAARTDIGIVSSIPFASGTPNNPSFRDVFENALGAPVSDTVVRQNLGYDHTALAYALGQLNGIVALIVTIGGVTPAKVAADLSRPPGTLTTPFLSLVGSTRDARLTNAPGFNGAVDLQNVEYDSRIDHLTNHLHFGNICLLQNGLSDDLISEEINQWPDPATIISVDIDKNTDAQGAFDTAFNTDISNHFDAVIISGDSYFTRNAPVLVPIANRWATAGGTRRWVVYPFVEYKAHGPANKHNYTIHGPELKLAFRRLGDKVARQHWGIEPQPQGPPEDN